jgi:hypothetical protein
MEIVTGAETCIRVGAYTAEPAGSSWLPVSDTGSETAGGGAAALLLARFDRLASAGRIDRARRRVLAVTLRASRA